MSKDVYEAILAWEIVECEDCNDLFIKKIDEETVHCQTCLKNKHYLALRLNA